MVAGSKMRTRLKRAQLLSTALLVVSLARLAVALRKSRALERHIGAIQQHSAAPTEPLLHDLREVAWSVSAASRYVPTATCLTQALAGSWLLARRGRTGEVRLSLPVSDSTEFRPHAWLISEGMIVLGGPAATFQRHRLFAAANQ